MAAEKNLSTACFKAYDIRPSSPSLAAALARGLNEGGADVQKAIDAVEKHFIDLEEVIQRHVIDGLRLEFADWRFNLRSSNTEPLLRLNAESRGDRELMKKKTREILDLLDSVE